MIVCNPFEFTLCRVRNNNTDKGRIKIKTIHLVRRTLAVHVKPAARQRMTNQL